MPDYTARKTTIFTGINDTPVSPTALVAGNGSHLIANLNGLIDDLNGAVFDVHKTETVGFQNINFDATDASFFINKYDGTNNEFSLEYYLGDLTLYGAGDAPMVALTVAGAININNVQVLTTQQPAIDSLSDSTGGTIDTTLYNVSGSGADTTINDNFASLNAQLEAILLAMRTHGLILTGGGGGS